jgi:capsular exopolysaccharide synthesis family protein
MNQLPPSSPYGPDSQAYDPVESVPVSPQKKFHLRKFLLAVRKFWWIVVLTLFLSATGAALNFYLTPPVFVSYAKMWQTQKLQLPEAGFTEDTEKFFGTFKDVLKSDDVRQNAIRLLQNSATNDIIYDRNGNVIDVGINVYEQPGSSVFVLEAESSNPAFTPLYLDAVMTAYREYMRTVRKDVSGDTLASISEQVQRLERDLKTDQDALTEFEQTNNFEVLQRQNEIAASYLAKLQTDLNDYQLQTRLLAAVSLEKDAALPGGTNILASPLFESMRNTGGGASPADQSQTAYQDIELLKLQRDRLSKYLRPAHPKIIALDKQIERSQKLIDLYREGNQQQIETARQALKIRMDNVQESIVEYENKVSSASKLIAEADSLKVNVSRNQALYDRLVELLQNVDISRNIDQETLAVLAHATPARRSYAEAKGNLTKAIFLGLAGGLGIIFLLSLRDDRLLSLVEVSEKISDNILGQVPEMRQLKGGEPLALLEDNDQRHMLAESYRSLRSALMYLALSGNQPKVMLVTSAVPNEGKSTVAANLARTLAMGGAKVLLIDADLRRGQLHKVMGLKSQPGLTNLLSTLGEPDLAPFIQTNSMANLSFMSRGAGVPNPGDLLILPAFDQVLVRLREQFDNIIIDTCPVMAADDAATLAPRVDGTLFVVRSHFSRARIVRQAMELLYQRHAKLLGVVLNRADSSGESYNYYKYEEYYSSAQPD